MSRRQRAPEPLRSGLLTVLEERGQHSDGEFDGHEVLRRLLGKTSYAQGASDQRLEIQDWVGSLSLEDAQRLISSVGLDEAETSELNGLLARAGEELEIDGEGRIVRSDGIAQVLGVLHLEHEAEVLLGGPLQPVLKQYQRALAFLDTHPMEQEKAVSEAVGALEAVVRLTAAGGGKDFGKNLVQLFAGQKPWTVGLSKILGQLQGFRNQTPGAGHGRYADSDITDAEVKFVVRAAGSAIAWVIEDSEAGRLP